jgi:hypothetical protein
MAKDVSRRFVITIAAKDSKKVKIILRDGQTEVDLRAIHVGLLGSLFSAASNAQKDLKKALQCIDCGEVIENLTDAETELVFTADDIGFLKTGWELTVDKRPDVWAKARDVLAQINDPKEKSEPEPAEDAEKKKVAKK